MKGIDLISRYAFHGSSDPIAYESMKILANALYLKPETRQTFVDLGNASKVVARYDTKGDNEIDNEFLCSRILFFLTYDTRVDFEELLVQDHLDSLLSQASSPLTAFNL